MLFEEKIKERLYDALMKFSEQIGEFSVRYHLVSAGTATAFLCMLAETVKENRLSLDSFYSRLSTALRLIIKIEEEHALMKKSDIWEEILLLQRLILQRESVEILLKQFETLNKNDELDLNFKLEAPTHAFVQIGRSVKPEHGNDIIFPNDRTLSRIHLVITAQNGQLYIEDRSANGTFLNGVKIEKGIKVPVKIEDEIRIGRDGTLVDLEHEKIQKLI